MPYTNEQYLQMIAKFNNMSFAKQLDTIIQNPGVLKVKIKFEIDIVGIDDETKDYLQTMNWFTINHGEIK